jgi:tRNA threonylcarbamoyladenosine biosynthesis protein TsaB
MPYPPAPDVAACVLAFDTATEQMALALQAGGAARARVVPGGAAASAALLPGLRSLLDDAGLAWADVDAIAWGCGPGAFTGLRTACAVAQGLGFGAGVPLLPIDTLHAVADEARHRFGAVRVVALLDARMDQVYAARYAFDGGDDSADAGAAVPELLAPEQVAVPDGWALAGNAFAAYGERLPGGTARHAVLPTAEALLRLAPALLAAGGAVAPADAWPLYVRDKVAQTTEERAALKAAAASAAAP